MKELQNRTLYFGDNLEILREKIPDESFDLIYLDPPFNSKRNYNLLYKEGLVDSPAQVQVFEDSWHWTEEAQHTFEELSGLKESKTKINENISNLIQALEKIVGKNDVLAYLVMMSIRLIELKRVLKPTGSIYLHCDPTASHYLKIIMDTIFDKKNFQNEIIWCYRRYTAQANRFQKIHDVILFYSRTDKTTFNQQFIPYGDKSGISDSHYKKDADGRWFRWQKRKNQKPYKVYLGKGVRIGDWWDIPIINSSAKERLGYPTQKPEALLERIIKASSNEGDMVLDPFCGCGTTVAVAEKLHRNWIGIDVTSLAIHVIKKRLGDKFPKIKKDIKIDGLPEDLAGAKELFDKDPYEFEYWALGLINAIPSQNKSKENMRGADKGIDGVITFYKGFSDNKEQIGKAVVQVKGGAIKRSDIATLKGDIERENADGGIFITLNEPTKPMKEEAISAGDFQIKYGDAIQEFPKVQILTVEELFKNKRPKLPLGHDFSHHKTAEEEESDNQQDIFGKFCPQCGQIHKDGESCTE